MGGGPDPVDLLILGAGWTSTFLIPLLESNSPTTTSSSSSSSPPPQHKITFAATTRNGRDGTIPFTFDPNSTDTEPYTRLPAAKVVLITFPLVGGDAAGLLIDRYEAVHTDPDAKGAKYILLGATSIWTQKHLVDEAAPYDKESPRAKGEDGLVRRVGGRAVVLCLAGLYGGGRDVRSWGGRVAKRKGDVKGKGAVHLVHGGDVARGVVGCVRFALGEGGAGGDEKGEVEGGWESLAGRRWIVTDLRTYDWWDLLMSFDGEYRDGGRYADGDQEVEYAKWVGELMVEEGVAYLPRERERLGRVLDGREFWRRLGIWPSVRRVS